MISELHLFIIWSNARVKETEILSDIANHFKVLGEHIISWEPDSFSKNLTRFYGENLPPHSNKEKLCGNGPFKLVVVLDEEPLYRTRMTSKGPSIVNVNMFDSKEMYRNWTGGGHMIHGTNSDKEARHDLVLLTGYSRTDYIKRYEDKGTTLTDSFDSMPGEKTWKDMNQVLYVLNETVDYVVLRNFSGLFSDYSKSLHGDVDILTDNKYAARLALNAKPVFKNKRRVQHIVKIGDGGVYFDIRYIGDNYYCKKWEKEILSKKQLAKENYYRTDEENFYYSLLYHALIQKKKVADDYIEIFADYFKDQNDVQLTDTLLAYLKEHQYSMNEPYDYSVYFNEQVTGKKMTMAKFANKAWHKLFHSRGANAKK